MDEQVLRIEDIVNMLRRRLKMVVAITGATTLVAITVAAVLPNEYQATTTVLVEPQTISDRLVEAGLGGDNITTRLHLMTMQILSRARLSRVIDDLEIYQDESTEMTREEIIEYMRGKIRVDPIIPDIAKELEQRDIQVNTFRLSFRHHDPRQAAAVANRLSNDFIDEHIRDRVQVSSDTAEFIENELSRLATRIRDVEARIAQVKAENAGTLPEDLMANQGRLSRTLDDLRRAQRGLAEAQSDEAYFNQQVAALRLSEAQNTNIVGEVASPVLQLQLLEIELNELRSRGFTDKHPDVIWTLSEMEGLRARIDSDDERGEGAPPASLAQQNAEAEARRAALRSEASREEIGRLQDEIEEAQLRLAATPRVAEQLDALQREYESLRLSYAEFSAKRLDAGVAANMERRQKGEKFRVLEPAFANPDPISPNRPLIVSMGFVLGLALAAGLALLLEAADASFRHPRAAQETLRIPVLASIPGILLDADLRAIRARRVREAVAAVVIAGVMLTGAAAGYVYFNMPDLLAGEEQEETAPASGDQAAQAG